MKLLRFLILPFAFTVLGLISSPTIRADEPVPAALPAAPPLPDKTKEKSLPPVFAKENPENIADLKEIEQQVREVLEKVLPCTVCVRAGGSGSGVIISEDGLVLTAGHVSGEPGRDITIVMPDGKRYKGKTLGGNGTIDSGMIKIVDKGKFPFVEIGKSSDMKKGDWCLLTGHPGGFKEGRSPVVRVGRILEINLVNDAQYIRTDCTLVGGDSGGPLFDMHGRVIGIHSRIGGSITANLHVPVDTYRESWDRLVKGERWGTGIGRNVRPTQGEPYLGITVNRDDPSCTISEVQKDSPADKAGLRPGDIITKFGITENISSEGLLTEIRKKRPGDEVTLEVLRGNEIIRLKVLMGRRPAE